MSLHAFHMRLLRLGEVLELASGQRMSDPNEHQISKVLESTNVKQNQKPRERMTQNGVLATAA